MNKSLQSPYPAARTPPRALYRQTTLELFFTIVEAVTILFIPQLYDQFLTNSG